MGILKNILNKIKLKLSFWKKDTKEEIITSNEINISLREPVLSSLDIFLEKENFPKNDNLKIGIVELINLISDYREEGNKLYPDIIITTDRLKLFKTTPNEEILIGIDELKRDSFSNILKLCAPLSINGWVIFIEIINNKITFGLTNSDMSETAIPFYNQLFDGMEQENSDFQFLYLKNFGFNTIELRGQKLKYRVSLSLNELNVKYYDELIELTNSIVYKCEIKYKININTFILKSLDNALKSGHGNLIGIIEDDEVNIRKLKTDLKCKGGIFLDKPIDFEEYVINAETDRIVENSIILKNYSSIFKSMMNHDGIFIITNKCRIVAYHILIDEYLNPNDKVDGGARTKAFLSMKNCGFFMVCFYKSQDGNSKLYKI